MTAVVVVLAELPVDRLPGEEVVDLDEQGVLRCSSVEVKGAMTMSIC